MGELLLTLSTATRIASVAVSRGETLLGELSIDPVRTQSEILLPGLEQLLADLALTVHDMDCFAVVRGPGAFTGLRVGVATVKGLAMAAGKPVVGVSSLQSLALQVPDYPGPVHVMIDARKGEVYAGSFSWEGGVPKLSGRERVVDPALLLDEIDGEALFVGDGATAYRTLIVRQLGGRARFAPWTANVLRAGAAAQLALAGFRAGEAVDPACLAPVYIRPSDAEINMPETAAGSGIEG